MKCYFCGESIELGWGDNDIADEETSVYVGPDGNSFCEKVRKGLRVGLARTLHTPESAII